VIVNPSCSITVGAISIVRVTIAPAPISWGLART
jgi:hypothetical protein